MALARLACGESKNAVTKSTGILKSTLVRFYENDHLIEKDDCGQRITTGERYVLAWNEYLVRPIDADPTGSFDVLLDFERPLTRKQTVWSGSVDIRFRVQHIVESTCPAGPFKAT